MTKHASRATPKVESGWLYTDGAFTGTALDSPAWFTWLATATTFYYESRLGVFTAHSETRRRGGRYWIVYRRQAGILRRVHLGKPEQLSAQRLAQVAVTLQAAVSPPLERG